MGERMSSDVTHTIARVLTSLVFVVFGFLQFTNIGTYIAHPAVVKVAGMTGGILTPTIIAYLVAAIDLFGGLCILIGFQTRWASLVLIVFVLLTCFLVHNFWTMEGPARAANMGNFYKNLVVIGALLMLWNAGSGAYSVDAKLGKR
jgi:putative oxidoreductase